MRHIQTIPSWILALAILSIGLAVGYLAPSANNPALIDAQARKGTRPEAAATYVGGGIYDDRDVAWTYTAAWVPRSLAGAYHSTLHVSATKGSTASFIFNGTGFTLTYRAYPNWGRIGVYLDGRSTPLTTLNSSGAAGLPKYTSPRLMPGRHSVTFKHAGPAGAKIAVDAIKVVDASPYYVDGKTGSDKNPGSQAQPWQTIQKAADTLNSGDTVIVAAGDYSTQRVNILRSGIAGSQITYLAQGQVVMKGFDIVANHVTIKGFEIANTDYRRWDAQTSAGVYVKGAYNILENNYIHDASLEGIELYGSPNDNTVTVTHNNIVRNNRLYRNELVGIDASGRNNLIVGNEIWRTVQCHPNLTLVEDFAPDNNGQKCPDYPSVKGLDADGIRFFGQGHIFRKNNIHDIVPGDTINGVNVNVKPHIDCFQTFASRDNETAYNIIFEQNYCENLHLRMHVFVLEGGANHIYIRNNIFVSAGGLHANGSAAEADYLYVYNNIWANSLAFGSQGYPSAIELGGIHAIVENNIFYNQPYHTVTVIGNTTNIKIDHNLAYNSGGATPHCIQWGNYDTCQPPSNHELWNANPRFVNPPGNDFHVRAGSPAINTGVNVGLVNDYAGHSRPQGAGYDIGAYEFPFVPGP